MEASGRSAYWLAFLTALAVFFSTDCFCSPDTVSPTSSDSSFLVKDIIIIVNKHTKDPIILRELTFHKGDTVHDIDSTFRRSEQNIMNTSLFHSADITCLKD